MLVHGLLLEPGQFAAGWLTGGNRRRFEAMATGGGPPMGIVASVSGEPVGWGACGPRSRYVAAEGGRTGLLRDRDRDENEAVWVLPYLFVGHGFRGQGVTYVSHPCGGRARSTRRCPGAIEGWPLAGSARRATDAFLGREKALEDLGFRCVGAEPVAHDEPNHVGGGVVPAVDSMAQQDGCPDPESTYSGRPDRPSSQVQVAEAGGLQGGDVPLAGVLLGVDVPGHGQPAADFVDGSEPVLVAPRVEAVEKERGVLDAVA